MSDPLHPTNGEWFLYDPFEFPPPRGVSLLLINDGGSLIIGPWYEGALAWGNKPKVPATVKARLTQKQQQQRENSNASKPESGSVDPDLAR